MYLINKKRRYLTPNKDGGNRLYKVAIIFFLSIYTAIVNLPIYGQEEGVRIPFRIMEWNVENLFDTRHDSLKEDKEFLPESLRRWNRTRYWKKLTDMARVIVSVGEWTPPALIGLCEVENDSVMRDLTLRSPLKELGYRYIMTQSPDLRGIDVALLYQRGHFKPLSSTSIRIPPLKHNRPTRDILHVSGLIATGDTLDVIVAHLPSRAGGIHESAPYRTHAARKLRETVDSLLHIRSTLRLIIMGDFNENSSGKIIKETLKVAEVPDSSPADFQKLYHLFKKKKKDFSYKYHGKWELIDHIIVSGSLLDESSSFHTSPGKATVFKKPFILQKDEIYGGSKPFRTYNGMKYQGGYSDHLPLYADFELWIK